MSSQSAISELKRQKLLLQLEYATEKDAFRKQTEMMGIARKVKRGDAWFPVRVGKSFYNSLNQLAVEVFRAADEEISHNFEYGRPVAFFQMVQKAGRHDEMGKNNASTASKSLSYFPVTGMVSYADNDRMVVTLPDNGMVTSIQTAEQVGVQLFFDETSYRLMFDALDRVMNAKDNRLAYLRNLFDSTSQTAECFSFDDIRFPWLNDLQAEAVNKVLKAKDVMVVHGPPGTGKTTTLVEAIYETLKRESQVLVCAQSNMAVDWISERLVDRGVNVLRIGNPTRVNDKMLSFTYERRFESHPDYPQLWAIRKALRQLKQHRKAAGSGFHQKVERLQERATELEIRIKAQLFGEARVIASTLTGASNRLLMGQKYQTLFIDEAAQALEAACWIAIRKVHRVVLAGDHCQLPPTIKSIAALKGGLDKTLMQRIVENKPEVVTMLGMQYRMNDQIMRFSSDWFYHGKVQSAPAIKYRGILDYDVPIQWIDTAEQAENAHFIEESASDAPTYQEHFVGESFGRINEDEAKLTLSTLEQYFNKIGKQRLLDEAVDVGIISPYRAQVQYLRRLIKKRPFFKPFRHLISVNTVDGFQGQERDVILISLVRANEDGQIGFLRDLRRMNVAMTRARMKLIILGHVPTLVRHPFYKKLYDYTQSLQQDAVW